MVDNNQENDSCLAIINNIPVDYHSCDLRNYFSQFLEAGGFICFHFRHRPEMKAGLSSENAEISNSHKTDQNNQTKEKRSSCCVIRLKRNKLNLLMKMYNRKHWVDKKGDVTRNICYISRVKNPTGKDDPKHVTRGERKTIPEERESFTESDLQTLPELHPPDLMPQGNIGTPTKTFMDYIKQCRLPPSIIKKLGLSFPRTKTSKQYGNVPFDYGGDVEAIFEDDELDADNILTADGHEIVSAEVDCDNNETNCDKTSNSKCDSDTTHSHSEAQCTNSSKQNKSSLLDSTGARNETSNSNQTHKNKRKKKGKKDEETKRRMKLNIEEKMIGNSDESEGDNDSCEEWERHEALYDDVANQERNKERLFEENIELKWEKGGSGLVFYTDAQYWHAQEGDFDEQTADDYDVDMSGYYEPDGGDKDARDSLDIRQEKQRRDGTCNTDRFTAGIASKKAKRKPNYEEDDETIGKFEAYTKGIGRKILETQGWSEGQGLGSTITGITTALESDGQKPKDKSGFGYRGEKINRHTGPAKRKVIISTIYDNPTDTDPNEPLLRRHDHYGLKYRDEIQFTKCRDVIQPDTSSVPTIQPSIREPK